MYVKGKSNKFRVLQNTKKERKNLMENLVKKAKSGDSNAFSQLIRMNTQSMYKVAWAYLKNDEDVADAISETILNCYEKLSTLKKDSYFKTWMIRILINECNKILSHYKKFNWDEEIPLIGQMDMSIAEFEFKEMLGRIDAPYRIILLLYYVEGFRISEIAEILDLNKNTVKTRLSRGRQQAKKEYFSPTSQNDTLTQTVSIQTRKG